MRIVDINTLRPGVVLGKALLDEKGQILLHTGVTLTETYIKALKAKGYQQLYISDAEAPVDIEPEEDISPATRSRAFQVLNKTFEAIGSEVGRVKTLSLNEVQKALEDDRLSTILSSKGPLGDVCTAVTQILDEVMTRPVLAGLTSIRSSDTQLYNHCIDVTVVAIMIARALGLPNHQVRQLAMGCMLHDIGMIFIEQHLSEKDRIRHHTLLGYELLKRSREQEILAPHVAFEHHERQDGSGLPRGLVGSNKIERNRAGKTPVPTLIGEIAAVANTYDALLSGSPSTQPLTPDKALLVIRNAAGTILNEEIVKSFLRVVPVFPLGMEIMVTDGKYKQYTGTVSAINSSHLDRPVIVLYRDAKRTVINPIEVNMVKEEDIQVRPYGGM